MGSGYDVDMKKKRIEPDKRTSVDLPQDLLRRAKIFALENDTNLRAVFVEALEKYLSKQGRRRR